MYKTNRASSCRGVVCRICGTLNISYVLCLPRLPLAHECDGTRLLVTDVRRARTVLARFKLPTWMAVVAENASNHEMLFCHINRNIITIKIISERSSLPVIVLMWQTKNLASLQLSPNSSNHDRAAEILISHSIIAAMRWTFFIRHPKKNEYFSYTSS